MVFPRLLLMAGLAFACTPALAADWLQFRGNDQTGGVSDAKSPARLDPSTLAWKVDLQGKGASSPIIVKDKLYLTSSSGAKEDRLHVLCFDLAAGKQLWERQFWATGRTLCHQSSAVAANSPACDGERIFAFYSSNDLICLDLDGNLLWYRGLTLERPAASNDVGMASSPIVVNGIVVVQIENQGDSFATGIDAATGQTKWQLDRPRAACWCSPTVLRGSTRKEDVVLLQNGTGITALEPATGELRWEYTQKSQEIASAATADGTVYLPTDGIVALKPGAGSNAPKVEWKSNKLSVGANSPAIRAGKIYTINKASVMNCADTDRGDVQWQVRVKGKFWGTPVITDRYAYLVNSDGLAQVVKLGEGAEVASEYSLDEPVLASPVVADGSVYVRSEKHLWKFSER